MFTDFEYADKRLSDFGWVAGHIGNNVGVSEVDIGCDITFNTIKNNHSSIHYISSTSYDNVCSLEPFDIFKNPCGKKQEDMYVTDDEISSLVKWLNRHEHKLFKPLPDSNEFSDIHYYGSFNIKKKTINDTIIGLTLTFNGNAPYGFGEQIKNEYESDIEILTKIGTSIEISDCADTNLQSLSLKGFTTQNTTEGNQLFDVDEFKNPDNWNKGANYYCQQLDLPVGTYTFSIKENNLHSSNQATVDNKIVMSLGYEAGVYNNRYLIGHFNVEHLSNYDSYTFNITENEKMYINLYVNGKKPTQEVLSTIFNELLIDIMLNHGGVQLPFENYTGGNPSPNPLYKQDVIHAGTLNSETGKYEMSLTISNSLENPTETQVIPISSDRPITKWDLLAERDGVIGWLYHGLKITVDGNASWENYEEYYGFSSYRALPEVMNRRNGYCNQLTVNINYDGLLNNNDCWLGVNNNQHLYCVQNSYFDDSLEDKGLANWKAHLNESPLEIWTYSDTEEFVPLSQEEQDAIKNINIYSPTTIITSDQNVSMEIKYTKEYDKTFSICGVGDEYRTIYPNISITCKQDGDLKIKNNLTGNIFEVSHCSKDETIYVNGEHKFIDSDNENHKSTTLFNDFNYNFLDINVTDDFTENIYEVSMPCKIVIDYFPIRKVGV